MKNIAYGLLSLVLLGVIVTWGPEVLQKMGDSGRRNIEEQAGVPIQVSWREAAGPGKVLILDYLNKDHGMKVTLQIRRPSSGEEKSIDIDLNPTYDKKVEVGWLEGWNFQLGDTVRVTSGNYVPKNIVLK